MNTYETIKRKNERVLQIMKAGIFGCFFIGVFAISAYVFGLKDAGQDWALHGGITFLMIAVFLTILRPVIRKFDEKWLNEQRAKSTDDIW